MTCNIHYLPNEILIQILNGFSTRALLPIAPTSPQFSSLILRILHYRLLLAASLPSYKLILEAYHPTRKYSEPYLFCTYLGTPGLSPTHEGEESPSHGIIPQCERYAKLNHLYSRFRPEKPGVEGSMPKRPYPAGGSGNQADSGSSSQPVYANDGDGGNQKVEHTINLDSHELFSQFCTIANLVKIGPRRGVFLSVVNVEEKVMRVWREWLDARAQAPREEEGEEVEMSSSDSRGADKTRDQPPIQSPPSILWTDYRRNVGLLLTVRNANHRGNGDGAISANEEEPASYSVEIKELLVRTTHLMLAVEESLKQQQVDRSGKAMIFGSFATAWAGSAMAS